MNLWRLWTCRGSGDARNRETDKKRKRLPRSEPQTASDSQDTSDGNDGNSLSPVFERSGNQMSVSRSGRYKQRLRKRSAIFENPQLGPVTSNGNSCPALSGKEFGNKEEPFTSGTHDSVVATGATGDGKETSSCEVIWIAEL